MRFPVEDPMDRDDFERWAAEEDERLTALREQAEDEHERDLDGNDP